MKTNHFNQHSHIWTVFMEKRDNYAVSFTYSFEHERHAVSFASIMRNEAEGELIVSEPQRQTIISGRAAMWDQVDEALDLDFGIEINCDCITTDMSGRCTHCLRPPAERYPERHGGFEDEEESIGDNRNNF